MTKRNRSTLARGRLTTCQLALGIVLALLAGTAPARGQDEPRLVPRFAVDLHGITNAFKTGPGEADSAGVTTADLPTRGFGADVTGTVYPFSWKAITFGLGAGFATSGGSSTLTEATAAQLGASKASVRFKAFSPQLSFNFGGEMGWSYISGGLGFATLGYSIDGRPVDAVLPRRQTLNYGAGGRWSLRDHLAFSFDIRFYSIKAVGATPEHTASPRATLFFFGAGVSFK